VLGLDFLTEHNPTIDWPTATLTFRNNMQVQCINQPRDADVQIIHANSMARMMKRNAKRDNGDVFFCAILKHYDAVTQDFDVEALNAEIAQIETDQSSEYTKRIRHLLSKHKKVCNPLHEVPISRPGLDHAIDLDPDFKYQSPKMYKLSKPVLEELKRQL
jgi:hypothetical protein